MTYIFTLKSYPTTCRTSSRIKNISNTNIDYVRIPSVDIASEQESLIQLDVSTKHALDLIKEITEIAPNMGLVMYTVRDDVGLSHSLQALGVTYLTKPASRIGLGEAVHNATNKIVQTEINGTTKMLIAEDTDSVRDILHRQLDKLGADAEFVKNGKEALNALSTGKYGILITDLHMPEMDGYELVEHIRRQEKLNNSEHLPIIVLTADVQMAQRETYLRHDFDECLLKPVSLGQFRRLLIRWGLLYEKTSDKIKMEIQTENNSNNDNDSPIPAINIKAIKQQMGAFDNSAIDMLHMFIDMTRPLIEKIQNAQNEKDFHILKETAHSLKGAARSACCNVLGDLASTLQDQTEKHELPKHLVEDIANEFKRIQIEIKNLKVN